MEAITEIGVMKTSYNISLMLSIIFDDEFATLYNWTGNKGKKSLASLMIIQMIVCKILICCKFWYYLYNLSTNMFYIYLQMVFLNILQI